MDLLTKSSTANDLSLSVVASHTKWDLRSFRSEISMYLVRTMLDMSELDRLQPSLRTINFPITNRDELRQTRLLFPFNVLSVQKNLSADSRIISIVQRQVRQEAAQRLSHLRCMLSIKVTIICRLAGPAPAVATFAEKCERAMREHIRA